VSCATRSIICSSSRIRIFSSATAHYTGCPDEVKPWANTPPLSISAEAIRSPTITADSGTERIGDFGLIAGGAAGLKLDRADIELGTPRTLTVWPDPRVIPTRTCSFPRSFSRPPSVSADTNMRKCAPIWFSSRPTTAAPCFRSGLWLGQEVCRMIHIATMYRALLRMCWGDFWMRERSKLYT
jgi:hypothetical protein